MLLFTAYRKSYMRNRLVPKWITLTFIHRSYQGHVNRCVTLDVEYLGIRKPLEMEAWFQRPPIENGQRGIKWSRERWRHVTRKGQTCDPSALRAQYLENSWRCYLATIANYYLVCCEAVRSAILATAWLLVLKLRRQRIQCAVKADTVGNRISQRGLVPRNLGWWTSRRWEHFYDMFNRWHNAGARWAETDRHTRDILRQHGLRCA